MKKRLENAVSFRLTLEDWKLLDLVAMQVPEIPRLALARLALRRGLEIFRKDPTKVLGGGRR